MNWEAVNWETVLWIGGIVLLIFFLMRGCGGMMGGGCGMGGRRHGGTDGADRGADQGGKPHYGESEEKS